jgi:CheY-like chemotaxis protein
VNDRAAVVDLLVARHACIDCLARLTGLCVKAVIAVVTELLKYFSMTVSEGFCEICTKRAMVHRLGHRKRLAGISILFVDDSAAIRASVPTYFQHFGANVIVTANGIEALAEFERARPTVIVSDLSMPGMSGLEFMERVRKLEGPRIPAIAYTASAHMEDAALAVGFDSFLVKPLSCHDVLEEIARLTGI